MKRKFHVRFLEEGERVIALSYSATEDGIYMPQKWNKSRTTVIQFYNMRQEEEIASNRWQKDLSASLKLKVTKQFILIILKVNF